MKRFDSMSYSKKIKLRLAALWVLLFAMLAYMIIVSELGGGDSRIMTDSAETVSRIIFFGGLLWIVLRIHHHRKLLRQRNLMKEQMLHEMDERNEYLHTKSGGVVMDVLLFVLLAITCTAALFNMPAYYTALSILLVALVLKVCAYYYYAHG